MMTRRAVMKMAAVCSVAGCASGAKASGPAPDEAESSEYCTVSWPPVPSAKYYHVRIADGSGGFKGSYTIEPSVRVKKGEAQYLRISAHYDGLLDGYDWS